MLTNFTQHFFRAAWHVKAVILMLIALVVACAAAITLF